MYIVYRRRCIKLNENKLTKKPHRPSREDNLLIHEPFEHRRLSIVQSLPTIIEENSATLSPSSSTNTLTPLSSLTNTTSSPVVTG